MQLAFYKGTDHLFNKLVVWKMEGPYSHCEAVFGINPLTGLYICASASFTDGGVRFKELALEPENWDIIEVPVISAARVAQWFVQNEFYLDAHGRLQRSPYDVRGLVNFIVPVGHNPRGWFCDEALGAACDVPQPQRFDPNSLACLLQRLGGSWIQGGPGWHVLSLGTITVAPAAS